MKKTFINYWEISKQLSLQQQHQKQEQKTYSISNLPLYQVQYQRYQEDEEDNHPLIVESTKLILQPSKNQLRDTNNEQQYPYWKQQEINQQSEIDHFEENSQNIKKLHKQSSQQNITSQRNQRAHQVNSQSPQRNNFQDNYRVQSQNQEKSQKYYQCRHQSLQTQTPCYFCQNQAQTNPESPSQSTANFSSQVSKYENQDLQTHDLDQDIFYNFQQVDKKDGKYEFPFLQYPCNPASNRQHQPQGFSRVSSFSDENSHFQEYQQENMNEEYAKQRQSQAIPFHDSELQHNLAVPCCNEDSFKHNSQENLAQYFSSTASVPQTCISSNSSGVSQYYLDEQEEYLDEVDELDIDGSGEGKDIAKTEMIMMNKQEIPKLKKLRGEAETLKKLARCKEQLGIDVEGVVEEKRGRIRSKKTLFYTDQHGKYKKFARITKSMIRPVCNALSKHLKMHGAKVERIDWLNQLRKFLVENEEYIPISIEFFQKHFETYVNNSPKLLEKNEYLLFRSNWIKGVSDPANFKGLKQPNFNI